MASCELRIYIDWRLAGELKTEHGFMDSKLFGSCTPSVKSFEKQR